MEVYCTHCRTPNHYRAKVCRACTREFYGWETVNNSQGMDVNDLATIAILAGPQGCLGFVLFMTFVIFLICQC